MHALVKGDLGDVSWLRLPVEPPEVLAAYPPLNEAGQFDAWAGIKGGTLALPDSSIAARVDTHWGKAVDEDIKVRANGLLAVSLHAQSLRGNLGNTYQKSDKFEWKAGCTKLVMVLKQFRTRSVHIAGVQEMRPFFLIVSMNSRAL